VIRVNLLPQKKKPERGGGKIKIDTGGGGGGGQKWLLIPLVLIVVEIVGLVLFHLDRKGQVDAQLSKNKALQGQINDAQQKVRDHDTVKNKLKELTAREDAITQLQSARTGPTSAVLELAQLLTPGKAPTFDPDRMKKLQKENPLIAFNPNWDSRRLWITNYTEQDRTVKLEGYAKDSQDVSELANRLKTSSYFYDINLLPGKMDETSEGLVNFGVAMKVRY